MMNGYHSRSSIDDEGGGRSCGNKRKINARQEGINRLENPSNLSPLVGTLLSTKDCSSSNLFSFHNTIDQRDRNHKLRKKSFHHLDDSIERIDSIRFGHMKSKFNAIVNTFKTRTALITTLILVIVLFPSTFVDSGRFLNVFNFFSLFQGDIFFSISPIPYLW